MDRLSLLFLVCVFYSCSFLAKKQTLQVADDTVAYNLRIKEISEQKFSIEIEKQNISSDTIITYCNRKGDKKILFSNIKGYQVGNNLDWIAYFKELEKSNTWLNHYRKNTCIVYPGSSLTYNLVLEDEEPINLLYWDRYRIVRNVTDSNRYFYCLSGEGTSILKVPIPLKEDIQLEFEK